nr:uncharacterized protein LOC109178682 isoform X1 [Ipomoea trifida]
MRACIAAVMIVAHNVNIYLERKNKQCDIVEHNPSWWLFYVDHVRHDVRPVPRLVHAFLGWNSDLLHQRKFAEIHGGCFGVGDIEPPVCDGAQLDAGGVEAHHSDDYSDGSHPPTPCEHGPKKTAAVAIAFLDLAQLLKYGNPIDFQGEVYRQMHEASQLLFGIKHPPSCVVPDVSHPIEPTFSQRDDLFWKNAENLRADFRDDGCAGADNIVREVSSPRFDRSGHMDPVGHNDDVRVIEGVRGLDMCKPPGVVDTPIDTGLTQDCRDDGWTAVDKIAHKYSSDVVDRSGHTDGVAHNADVQVVEDVRGMDMCTHSSLVDTPTDASPPTGDDVPSSGLGAKCPQFVTPYQECLRSL